MKKSKFTLTLFTLMSFNIGVIIFYTLSGRSNPIEIGIIGLIVLLGVIQLYNSYKNQKKIENGLTISDELSESLKHRSGYITFKYSFYVWLLYLYLEIFGIHLEVYQIVGSGVILTSFLFLIIKKYYETKLNEK